MIQRMTAHNTPCQRDKTPRQKNNSLLGCFSAQNTPVKLGCFRPYWKFGCFRNGMVLVVFLQGPVSCNIIKTRQPTTFFGFKISHAMMIYFFTVECFLTMHFQILAQFNVTKFKHGFLSHMYNIIHQNRISLSHLMYTKVGRSLAQ